MCYVHTLTVTPHVIHYILYLIYSAILNKLTGLNRIAVPLESISVI